MPAAHQCQPIASRIPGSEQLHARVANNNLGVGVTIPGNLAQDEARAKLLGRRARWL